jgi:hypothetical protein
MIAGIYVVCMMAFAIISVICFNHSQRQHKVERIALWEILAMIMLIIAISCGIRGITLI